MKKLHSKIIVVAWIPLLLKIQLIMRCSGRKNESALHGWKRFWGLRWSWTLLNQWPDINILVKNYVIEYLLNFCLAHRSKQYIVPERINQTGRLPEIWQENSNKQRRNFIRPIKAETDRRSTDTLLSKVFRWPWKDNCLLQPYNSGSSVPMALIERAFWTNLASKGRERVNPGKLRSDPKNVTSGVG